MKIVTDFAYTLWGMEIGKDRHSLRLNMKELATLKRAAAIREEARDRISAALGIHSFESGDHYTLSIDDLLDGSPTWDNLDIDLMDDSKCATCISGEHR